MCALLCVARGTAHGQAAAPNESAREQAARKAKAAGYVLEAANDDAVAGCRYLGDTFEDTAERGISGQLGIRNALKRTGRARGASHVRYADHVTIRESGAQREHGLLYDCTQPALATGPSPAAAAPADPASADPVSPASATSASPAEPAAPRPERIAFSGLLEVVPVGTLHTKVSMQEVENDIPTAFGVRGNFMVALAPYFAIGFDPGVVLGLKPTGSPSSATQIDARARLQLGRSEGDGFHEYGYATAGASWILPPGDSPTANGAVLGLGVGVLRRVESASFVLLEVGLQAGFQSTTIGSSDVQLSSRTFHIGLGFGRYLSF